MGVFWVVQLNVKHVEAVLNISFAPDGSVVASASDDGRVLIWEAATGIARALPGRTLAVFAVAFAPDGKTIAANCWDGKKGFVELRDYPSGEVRATFGDRKRQGWAIGYSPNGSLLAVDGDHLQIWDVATSQRLRTLRTGGMSLSFAPDGKTLATGAIQLTDVETGKEVRALDGKPGGVYSVAFSPDGKSLATVANDLFADKRITNGPPPGIVKVWDVATGLVQSEFKGTYEVRSVAFSPDGRTLAVGQQDGNILYWDTTARRIREIVRATRPGINALAYSPDGKILAAGCQDGTVKMLRPPQSERIDPQTSR